jgi:hypothetical protein
LPLLKTSLTTPVDFEIRDLLSSKLFTADVEKSLMIGWIFVSFSLTSPIPICNIRLRTFLKLHIIYNKIPRAAAETINISIFMVVRADIYINKRKKKILTFIKYSKITILSRATRDGQR